MHAPYGLERRGEEKGDPGKVTEIVFQREDEAHGNQVEEILYNSGGERVLELVTAGDVGKGDKNVGDTGSDIGAHDDIERQVHLDRSGGNQSHGQRCGG